MMDIVERLQQPFGYFSRALRCAAAEEIQSLRAENEALLQKLDVCELMRDDQRAKLNIARNNALVTLGLIDEKPVQWSDMLPEGEEDFVQAS
jgi:hypothetical protein